jgi:hypothetical protein
MKEIKPNWIIAQQISRRHTVVSLSIMLCIVIIVSVFSVIILKCLGYEHSGVIIKHFIESHQRAVTSAIFFIHFVPVNYYAIIRVFTSYYTKFELKIFSK